MSASIKLRLADLDPPRAMPIKNKNQAETFVSFSFEVVDEFPYLGSVLNLNGRKIVGNRFVCKLSLLFSTSRTELLNRCQNS